MARVDQIAEHLSKLSGRSFEVIRVNSSVFGPNGHKEIIRYALKGELPAYEYGRYYFGGRGVKLQEMERFLATLVDMINDGMIPIRRTE